MLHGMNNTYLYTAKKIIATWRRGDEIVQITGTGFIINKDDNPIFVTNRHVVEPGYSDPNYKDFSIETMCFENLGVAEDNSMPRELVTINILNWDEFKFHPNSNNDVACLIGIDTDKPAEISFSIPYELVASDDWISQNYLFVIASHIRVFLCGMTNIIIHLFLGWGRLRVILDWIIHVDSVNQQLLELHTRDFLQMEHQEVPCFQFKKALKQPEHFIQRKDFTER